MTPEERKRLQTLALGGGFSGAIMGGATSLLGGAGKWGKVAQAAGLGALGGSALASGSGYVGGKVLDADPNDPTSNTKRGAIGGLLAGAVGGLGLGALMKIPAVKSKVVAMLSDAGKPGIMAKAIDKMPLKKVALGTGLVGAGAGAMSGYDEGMQADFIKNIADQAKEKKRRKMMMEYANA
jgi:hypothetical protein